ncbi:MAG: transposase [Gammaproteobacteria bacterium]|nr:transposase [Gammaproteobacteria bacterium]
MRNGLLNGELFYTVREPQMLIEQWSNHHHRVRANSALGLGNRPHPPRIFMTTPKRAPYATVQLEPINSE